MRILCKSTPLTRALAIAAMLFVMLFPVGAHAAPATQAHPPAGCTDYIERFTDDYGHFSEDIPLKSGHAYTLDVLGRSPVLPVVAVYRSDATFNLNDKAVAYKTDAGSFLQSSDFPIKGARADQIEIPENGALVQAYVSSGNGLSFTIRVCDKGSYKAPTSIPPLASPTNPFCGKTWPVHYSESKHDVDNYAIIDVPGTYDVSITGQQGDQLAWYYGDDVQSRQAVVPFTVNGRKPYFDVDYPSNGNASVNYYSFFSEFPVSSSADRVVLRSGEIHIVTLAINPNQDDSFTIRTECVK